FAACRESAIFSMQSLPSRRLGGHGSGLSASQMPEKSGFPSRVRGAGALRFGAPEARRGTPGVSILNHCADTGAVSSASTPAIAAARVMARHLTAISAVLRRGMNAVAEFALLE